MRDSYVLQATTDSGMSVLIAPVTIAKAMEITDEHLTPNGWHPKYRPITPPEEAVDSFTRFKQSTPSLHADVFVQLRRAIVTDRDLDGIDDPRVGGLISQIDRHRPLQLWSGPEECLLAECEHDRRLGQFCPDVKPAETLCRNCTVIYDDNSEYGPRYDLPVGWPCSVLTAAADRWRIEIPSPASRNEV